MIAIWILYHSGLSLVLGLAALAAEKAFLRWSLPIRWVWFVAMVMGPLLPLALLLAARPPRGGSGVVQIGEPTVVSTVLPLGDAVRTLEGTGIGVLDRPLIALWILASLVLTGALLLAQRRLTELKRTWMAGLVNGEKIWISEREGPAVVGFWSTEIVIPRWALELEEDQIALMLAHEREHIRAGDPRMLLAALVSVVALPWNAALWWQLRRLRLAIEVDCDRRVLVGRDVGAYGSLLLDVGRRSARLPLAVAAFSHGTGHLERRVRIMTSTNRRYRLFASALASAFAVALLLVACEMEPPMGPGPSTASPLPNPMSTAELAVEPTFTPFEERPELINRAEFGQALEAAYPPVLKEAGVGGTAIVWAFILRDGTVGNTTLQETSGRVELDEMALEILRIARFSPARIRGEPVDVWIALPITFQTASAAD